MNCELSTRKFVGALAGVAAVVLWMATRLWAADDIQNYYFKKDTIRVLVLSGRDNHDWRTSTPFMEKRVFGESCG